MARLEETGTLSREDLRECFREMLLIRRFEEKVEERFRAGELPGFLHVAIGQEAVAVGVCRALEEGDTIASTHRAHGHTLALGTPPNAVMAELYDKVDDGQDVEAVYAAAREALDYARSGNGPVFLDVETYRLVGHYVGDPQIYRDKEEVRRLRETEDPIRKLRERLELSDDELGEIDAEVTEIVEASVEFAKSGTDPAPEDALKNVYA